VKILDDLWDGIKNPVLIIIQDTILVIILLFGWFIITNTVKILFPSEKPIVCYLEQASGIGGFIIYIIFLFYSIYDYYIKRKK